MNNLIREHMMNIQQVAANAGSNMGPVGGANGHTSGQSADVGPFNRNGISVNNFDQSPMPNSNANALDQKFFDDGASGTSQAKQKNANLKFLQTN